MPKHAYPWGKWRAKKGITAAENRCMAANQLKEKTLLSVCERGLLRVDFRRT